MPMKTIEAQRPIELTLPAGARMLLIIRLITGGRHGARRADGGCLEDVKMAVEEACNCLLRCDLLRIAEAVVLLGGRRAAHSRGGAGRAEGLRRTRRRLRRSAGYPLYSGVHGGRRARDIRWERAQRHRDGKVPGRLT